MEEKKTGNLKEKQENFGKMESKGGETGMYAKFGENERTTRCDRCTVNIKVSQHEEIFL